MWLQGGAQLLLCMVCVYEMFTWALEDNLPLPYFPVLFTGPVLNKY